jgi:hypothetical protein
MTVKNLKKMELLKQMDKINKIIQITLMMVLWQNHQILVKIMEFPIIKV